MVHGRHPCLTLGRRAFALGAACGVLGRPAAALVVPPRPRIGCRVIRAGHDIGSADYAFSHDGDRLTVAIEVEIKVRIGFITVFRYAHTNTEHWQGERLMDFSSRTTRNGTINFAAARWNGTALDVTGSAVSPYTAPGDAVGTSFWSNKTLTAPLINAENGKRPRVKLAAIGPSQAVLSTGGKVDANEYAMTGDLHLNLWYDTAGNWAGMQYFAHDGSMLTYEKI